MKLGENLKKCRKEHGMSQEELATQINVTRQAISAWETGKTVPAVSTLKILADYYNISIEELCGIEIEEKNMEFTRKNSSKFHNFFQENKYDMINVILYFILMFVSCHYLFFGFLFNGYVMIFYYASNKLIQNSMKLIGAVCWIISSYEIYELVYSIFVPATFVIEKL